MTAKRIQTLAFGLMLVTLFTVYSATKDRPIQTSKLFVSLVLALVCYGLASWAAKKT